MNLKKMSKRSLIAEIRRLKKVEIQRNELREEIFRMDEATKNWKLITPLACIVAHQLMSCENWKQEDAVWEKFWNFMDKRISEKRISDFWAERCADLTDEYRGYLINYADIFKAL